MKKKEQEEVTRVAESVWRVLKRDSHSIALGDPPSSRQFNPDHAIGIGLPLKRYHQNGDKKCKNWLKPNSQLVHRPMSLNPKGSEEWRLLF